MSRCQNHWSCPMWLIVMCQLLSVNMTCMLNEVALTVINRPHVATSHSSLSPAEASAFCECSIGQRNRDPRPTTDRQRESTELLTEHTTQMHATYSVWKMEWLTHCSFLRSRCCCEADVIRHTVQEDTQCAKETRSDHDWLRTPVWRCEIHICRNRKQAANNL